MRTFDTLWDYYDRIWILLSSQISSGGQSDPSVFKRKSGKPFLYDILTDKNILKVLVSRQSRGNTVTGCTEPNAAPHRVE